MSDEQLVEYDQETCRLIKDQEQHVTSLELQYVGAKNDLARAKRSVEAAKVELRKLIRDRNEQRGQPTMRSLFETSTPVEPDTAEEWREFSIRKLGEFGLPGKVIDKVSAAGIDTLGQLSDFTNPSDGGWAKQYQDIPGVGDKAATAIEDAWMAFWVKHQASNPHGG
jgi:hypothetical protein